MSVLTERIKNGILNENPIYGQVLAMCPTLAVSTSMENAVGMGIAATAVLVASNIAISAIRKLVPNKIRIPIFIVIIASFVTITQFLLQGFVPTLYKSLGIFIPLIVVNCVILGRAEAYAQKSGVIASLFDGIGMGVGFTLALMSLAIFREVLGAGTFFGMRIMPLSYQPAIIMILAPGAFFTMGIIMAGINLYRIKKAKPGEQPKLLEPGCANCTLYDSCAAASKSAE
ncbi:electron transport complex subunit RnfE [Oxobacter pfennigii]|uniref:Ion-translocating oxidoreductase complex subunit E n=1 Tax=Oxobacter pfennigii TaxID=36849 RepID=A0A0P8YA66_9CLOT|nr:electron transport complex subunit E [Oxobacter pfennigii]KPU43837.1 electron transport complex subunit RnfE [Oxobacter pfennigii]